MKWIHDRLCKWLGIWDIEFRLDKQRTTLRELEAAMGRVEQASRVSIEAVRKAINNKMDPRSPFDPERKAESDKIGEQVLKQLYAEDRARRHTEGKL